MCCKVVYPNNEHRGLLEEEGEMPRRLLLERLAALGMLFEADYSGIMATVARPRISSVPPYSRKNLNTVEPTSR